MFLVNLMVTVALVKGLLHSDSAKKSNETIKLAILFQNNIKKITKSTELRAFCHILLQN